MSIKVTASPLSVSLGLKTVARAPKPLKKGAKAQLLPPGSKGKKPAPAPAKPAKPVKKGPAYKVDKDRPTKNGKTRPSEGTTGGKMWAALDKFKSKHRRIATLEEAQKLGKGMKLNETSVVLAYYRWRKFNGIKGRQ